MTRKRLDPGDQTTPVPGGTRRPAVTSPSEAAPALVMDGVVAGYGGGDVLRGVTFAVPEGKITCVVGPNGAGKSTVMKAISGLLKPRLGTVTLRGEKITGKSPRSRRTTACSGT